MKIQSNTDKFGGQMTEDITKNGEVFKLALLSA